MTRRSGPRRPRRISYRAAASSLGETVEVVLGRFLGLLIEEGAVNARRDADRCGLRIQMHSERRVDRAALHFDLLTALIGETIVVVVDRTDFDTRIEDP